MVRSFLDGRFENTVFCLLAPDGKERLSGTGRSPVRTLGARGPRGNPEGQKEAVLASMKRVAGDYKSTGRSDAPVVQDFHSFRQALNVASGDQRLLLLVAASEKSRGKLGQSLRPVLGDPEMIGRFHCDFADRGIDENWAGAVGGVDRKSGLFIIQPGRFGMEGTVLARLPLKAEAAEIKAALTKANAAFAKSEERKVYSEHVAQARREGVYFEGGMPYGEDRDGDGEIDHRRGRPGAGGRRGSGRGRPGGPPRGR